MTQLDQRTDATYCSNCGGDLGRGDAFCRECGARVGGECPLCQTYVNVSDLECPSCGAAPCADCDAWSLRDAKFCPGCGGQLLEEREEQAAWACAVCDAPISADALACSACGAVRCDDCGEWSSQSARFCHGCGTELNDAVEGNSPAPLDTNARDVAMDDGAEDTENSERGDAWRRLLFGGLRAELSTSQPDADTVAAYLVQLGESGIDWHVALAGAATFPGANLSPDLAAVVESLVEPATVGAALREVMQEADSLDASMSESLADNGHETTCDRRHTPRQRCNSNRDRSGAA
jgi:hypothetical protein